jgi:hypothetical protein
LEEGPVVDVRNDYYYIVVPVEVVGHIHAAAAAAVVVVGMDVNPRPHHFLSN